ncbi:MAG: hypothetical protein A2007_06420 [Verrucomicrobia bacterium GWC2_42_7]|nr:MAG: hypothetical protein A2007_06420 [Verrucomicrobia bacterium GWC2_42_7]
MSVNDTHKVGETPIVPTGTTVESNYQQGAVNNTTRVDNQLTISALSKGFPPNTFTFDAPTLEPGETVTPDQLEKLQAVMSSGVFQAVSSLESSELTQSTSNSLTESEATAEGSNDKTTATKNSAKIFKLKGGNAFSIDIDALIGILKSAIQKLAAETGMKLTQAASQKVQEDTKIWAQKAQEQMEAIKKMKFWKTFSKVLTGVIIAVAAVVAVAAVASSVVNGGSGVLAAIALMGAVISLVPSILMLADVKMPEAASYSMMAVGIALSLGATAGSAIASNATAKVAEKVAEEIAEEVAKQLTKELTKKVSQEVIKEAAEEAAKQAAQRVIQQAAEKATAETIRETMAAATREAAGKLAKEVGAEVGEAVIKEAGEKAANAVAVQTAKSVMQKIPSELSQKIGNALAGSAGKLGSSSLRTAVMQVRSVSTSVQACTQALQAGGKVGEGVQAYKVAEANIEVTKAENTKEIDVKFRDDFAEYSKAIVAALNSISRALTSMYASNMETIKNINI